MSSKAYNVLTGIWVPSFLRTSNRNIVATKERPQAVGRLLPVQLLRKAPPVLSKQDE